MYKYAIERITTDLLDCSTHGDRDYIVGDSKIVLHKWKTNPTAKYFEESEASILLSALPGILQDRFRELELNIIEYIKALSVLE